MVEGEKGAAEIKESGELATNLQTFATCRVEDSQPYHRSHETKPLVQTEM